MSSTRTQHVTWRDTAGCRPQLFTTRCRVLLLGVFAAQSDVINTSNVATLSEKTQQKWSNPRWRSRLIVMWIYWKIICWNDHYITGLTQKEQEHLWTTQPGYLSLKLQVWVRAALFGSYWVSGFWQNALLVITGWHKEECVKWCLQPSRRLAEGPPNDGVCVDDDHDRDEIRGAGWRQSGNDGASFWHSIAQDV